MKNFFFVLLALLTGALGWWAGTQRAHLGEHPAASRKILFYQSTMHPWVKSDRPGKCTVCGMDLVPVYEGSQPVAETPSDLVLLGEGVPTVADVKTTPITKQPLKRKLRVAGIIDDDDSKHQILSAYTSGRIEKLFVNFEGGEVEAGQPLATFYSKELLSAAAEYRALKKSDGLLLAGADSRLRQLGLTPEQIAGLADRPATLTTFEIVAPRGGTVTKRHVYPGQYVNEGDKLFEIADFTTMWFQFMAYEQDLPFLRVGQHVEISTPSLAGKTLSSTIKFINPNLDEATRTARVRVEIENPLSEGGKHRGHEVLHRLYATGEVDVEYPEVIAVPRNAVIWPGGAPRVYVEKGPGAYQQRLLKLGRTGDEAYEVLEGLTPGERVVTSGNMLLDGQAQLNHLAAGEPAAEVDSAPARHQALEAYFVAVAAMAESLAADDFAGYQSALAKLPPPPEGLPSPPASATDILAARRAFLPFSQKVAEFLPKVRSDFPALKVFRCPMSNELGAGVPANALWIQLGGQARNPFLAPAMLSCGVEVK